MLRIIQNRAAASAKSYYSHSDYLSEGQELAGRWGGKTAALLGLSGPVEKADFEALCDNRDPQSGNPLTARTKQDRTVGYDFNFHVPTGVSLAFALSGDERWGATWRHWLSRGWTRSIGTYLAGSSLTAWSLLIG